MGSRRRLRCAFNSSPVALFGRAAQINPSATCWRMAMFRSRHRSGSTSRASSTLPAHLCRRKRNRLRQCHFEQLEKRINLDTYLWHQTAATTFNWTDSGNWTERLASTARRLSGRVQHDGCG